VILYLDTSSLVKLYVEEMHSDKVREWLEEAELVATCRVAYPH
jgi:predicted nucleic acid-binding protein